MNEVFESYFKRESLPVKVGLFAVGLETYWPQFAGLKDKLIAHHNTFAKQLTDMGFHVEDAGVVDNSAKAYEAGLKLNALDVDLLICNVFTYSVSSNALPVVQKVGRPVLLVALQPDAHLDYENATTVKQLENDNVTSLPEISCAMLRSGVKPADIIVGQLNGDKRVAKKLKSWLEVGRCLNALRKSHIGLMGHVYEGMLDMNSDPTMFDGKFGMHVEHIEMDDLQKCVDGISDSDVENRVGLIKDIFHFPKPGSDPLAGEVDPEELKWVAKVSLAMDKLVEDFKLDGLAYYYRGLAGNTYEKLGCSLIVGASLLTGRGVPIAGEYDIKNCVAMMIMDRLGAGGSFAELHPLDFDGDFVLVGHDGPHHIKIAEGQPILRSLSVLHGKRGSGPSVEFALKNGPITMLGITQTFDGRFKFVVAEGESVAGIVPATGNTNTRGKFKPDVATFIEKWSIEGPTHHLALGIGHKAKEIEMLAKTLDIECVVVAREA
ncbi:MAG: arabinose isomerase [Sedimentisphaeraceae bacterium JB056]